MNNLVKLKNTDWYLNLVEECQSIIVEKTFNSRMEIIQGKWEIGKSICDSENYEKYARNNNFIAQFANDIGCSKENLYQCAKFYRKFPEMNKIEELPEGKNLSWYKITQQYLGEKPKEKAEKTYFGIKTIIESFNKTIGQAFDIEETDKMLNSFLNELKK